MFTDHICLVFKKYFKSIKDKPNRKIDLAQNKYTQTKMKHAESN